VTEDAVATECQNDQAEGVHDHLNADVKAAHVIEQPSPRRDERIGRRRPSPESPRLERKRLDGDDTGHAFQQHALAFPMRLVSALGELVYLSQPVSQHDAGRDRRHQHREADHGAVVEHEQ
jgi:hypothetical protein